MPDLTLEQVREAGRFAWCEEWESYHDLPLFIPEYGLFLAGTDWTGNWERGHAEPDSFPATEWHHLPGCTCEYCS